MSVFVHGSTCITIAISVNIMHIAILNVGKQKRHFSTSKLTKSLPCNHKRKTYVSTPKLTKSLSCNHKRKTYVSTSKLTKSLSCNHKRKMYVSTSKLTKTLSWNDKHKTYVSTSNVINCLTLPKATAWLSRAGQADTSMTSRTKDSTQTPKKSTIFSGQYLRNHWTLDIGVLDYIGIVWPKEHSPEVWSVPPVTPYIYNEAFEVHVYLNAHRCDYHQFRLLNNDLEQFSWQYLILCYPLKVWIVQVTALCILTPCRLISTFHTNMLARAPILKMGAIRPSEMAM